MPDKPNPDKKAMTYTVKFRITGTVTVDIDADSADKARAEAEAMMKAGNSGWDLEEIDGMEIVSIRADPVLHRLLHIAREPRVTHLAPGDLPRDPDERGF